MVGGVLSIRIVPNDGCVGSNVPPDRSKSRSCWCRHRRLAGKRLRRGGRACRHTGVDVQRRRIVNTGVRDGNTLVRPFTRSVSAGVSIGSRHGQHWWCLVDHDRRECYGRHVARLICARAGGIDVGCFCVEYLLCGREGQHSRVGDCREIVNACEGDGHILIGPGPRSVWGADAESRRRRQCRWRLVDHDRPKCYPCSVVPGKVLTRRVQRRAGCLRREGYGCHRGHPAAAVCKRAAGRNSRDDRICHPSTDKWPRQIVGASECDGYVLIRPCSRRVAGGRRDHRRSRRC